MIRFWARLAVGVAAMVALAPAGHADVWSDLQACRKLGDAERLACFDRVLAQHDTASAPAPARPEAPAAAKPTFGEDRLPQSETAAKEPESMVAKVAAVRWNAFKHFTVTLDNGQVWRQLDSDTVTADLAAAATVKITRGFLSSYSLSIEGAWGTFKVKRIK
jgi:hypothetical protein